VGQSLAAANLTDGDQAVHRLEQQNRDAALTSHRFGAHSGIGGSWRAQSMAVKRAQPEACCQTGGFAESPAARSAAVTVGAFERGLGWQ